MKNHLLHFWESSQPEPLQPPITSEATLKETAEIEPHMETTGTFLDLRELQDLVSKQELFHLLKAKHMGPGKLRDCIQYLEDLEHLQVELVKLQNWVQDKKIRLAILFEGRDTAGKGGAIRRFTEHLNPRAIRIVALPKPSEAERGQWYFQRYTKHLPERGEMVFFDRSWYNRAVVEPVNGFCTTDEYEVFLRQVNNFERMLAEDGIVLIKFWFSISKEEQLNRLKSRTHDPLKQWKVSPVDQAAQKKWDAYTHYKNAMFHASHTEICPWIVVKANNKRKARLETIRYVLSLFDYKGKHKAKVKLSPDAHIVAPYNA